MDTMENKNQNDDDDKIPNSKKNTLRQIHA